MSKYEQVVFPSDLNYDGTAMIRYLQLVLNLSKIMEGRILELVKAS